MNILLANISTFSFKSNLTSYRVLVPGCSKDFIEAYHTNDSVLQCVSNLNEVILSGGLHKVIALISQKAWSIEDDRFNSQTAFGYYCSKAKEYNPDCMVTGIRIENEDGSSRDIAEILSDICEQINIQDVVYIDSAGGMRTINNVIQVLTNILRYKGIVNPCTLYADIQNDNAKIVDTSVFVRITNLADAFNEFMTTGKADQLQECLKEANASDDFANLVKSMVAFSDRIRIGDVETLDSVIEALRANIERCNNSKAISDLESVVVKQFLPLIEERLVGQTGTKVDYAKLITWCLDNVLIQQALTLFVEKIPSYIFNNNILHFDGDKDRLMGDFSINSIANHGAWEAFALYTDLLKVEKGAKNRKIEELTDCLLNSSRSSDTAIKEAMAAIESFKYSYPYSSIIQRNEKVVLLKDFIRKNRFLSYGAFVKTISNNKKLQALLLGFEPEVENPDENKTIANKFKAINLIIKENALSADYHCSCPVSKFVEILYGYVYIKSLRNQINHASSDENLSDKQKETLSARGYDFSENNIVNIKSNIARALSAVIDALPEMPLAVAEEEIEYSKGDIAVAVVVDKKTVRLPGCSDNVALVVPKGWNRHFAVGDSIDVTVHQVSNDKKVIQVKLI